MFAIAENRTAQLILSALVSEVNFKDTETLLYKSFQDSPNSNSPNQSVLLRSCFSLVHSDTQIKSFLFRRCQQILTQKNPFNEDHKRHFSVFAD